MIEKVGALDRVGEVWQNYQFDPAPLEVFCRKAIAGFCGPLTVAQFHGGASNPTFLLTDQDTGIRYVLRKKPPGDLMTSAHAIDREYRVMRALASTAVPVPEMLCYCDDPSLIGTAFYLMPFLEGRIYKDNRLGDMGPKDQAAAYGSVATTLATLHNVDVAAVGLADFGRAGNYFARQLARWSRQYREAETETITAMDRVMQMLPERIPSDDRCTLVHGDFRMENIMFAVDQPRVIAVLDWELSTLGHPLADLAYFCLFYHAEFAGWGSAETIDFAATGIPDETRFLDEYCAAAGIETIQDWTFYLSFAAFRLAAIAQGVHARSLAGTAQGPAGNRAIDWALLASQLLSSD